MRNGKAVDGEGRDSREIESTDQRLPVKVAIVVTARDPVSALGAGKPRLGKVAVRLFQPVNPVG